MLDPEKAYNGFAVDDVHKAKEFYEETLGLNASFVDRGQQLLQLELGGGTPTLVYTKPEFSPATYTASTSRSRTWRELSTSSPPGESPSSDTTSSTKMRRASLRVARS